MFCLDAHSRFREGDAGGRTSVVALRDRMIRPRSSSWLYNHAVETAASAATVLKTWWPGTELNRRRQPFQGWLPPLLSS
jgi:hypothetical protein